MTRQEAVAQSPGPCPTLRVSTFTASQGTHDSMGPSSLCLPPQLHSLPFVFLPSCSLTRAPPSKLPHPHVCGSQLPQWALVTRHAPGFLTFVPCLTVPGLVCVANGVWQTQRVTSEIR